MEHGDWELSIQPRLEEPVPAETLLQSSPLHLPHGLQSPEGNSSDPGQSPHAHHTCPGTHGVLRLCLAPELHIDQEREEPRAVCKAQSSVSTEDSKQDEGLS